MTDPAILTDAELCEAVAREVLEWEHGNIDEVGTISRKGYIRTNPDGSRSEVRLLMDWSGIGQVVEAMQDLGYRYALGDWKPNMENGLHICTMTYGGDGEPPGRFFTWHRSESLPRAVFVAALEAVRSVET